MDRILGIDFGTSQCSVSWFNPATGSAELLRNAEGYEKTPSVVYFSDSEVVVGSAAELMLEDESARENVQIGIKHDIGKDIVLHLGGKDRKPTEIAAEIFRKLKADAEQLHFKDEVSVAVVTHPATFSPIERERLADAATFAGFERVILLPEPEAAAIAVGHAGVDIGRTVLVYDLGAGTFDLTLLIQLEDGSYRLPIGSRGSRLGGDDFDRALYDFCDKLALQEHDRGITNGHLSLDFMRACRLRKETLSIRDKCDIKTLLPGDPPTIFQHQISRKQYEALIQPIVDQTVQTVSEMVEEAERMGHVPDSILLIGGSTRTPIIGRLLREAVSVEPAQWQQQDVAVALGAALHGKAVLMKENPQTNGPSSNSGQAVTNDIPLVESLELTLHRSLIDAQNKAILIHAEVSTGLIGGASEEGIPVNIFFNGKPCLEILTDNFGRAVLEQGIDPQFFRPGTNEISARVAGTSTNAKQEFQLLANSRITRFSRKEKRTDYEKYDWFSESEYRATVKVEWRLSNEDLVEPGSVECFVEIVAKDPVTSVVQTDGTGAGSYKKKREYSYERDFEDPEDSVYRGKRFNKLKRVNVSIVGFPESFVLTEESFDDR